MKHFILILYLPSIFLVNIQEWNDRSKKYLPGGFNERKIFNSPAGNSLRDTFIVINKSKIYYQKKGKGPTSVVFVSGLGEDHNSWQTVQDSVSRYVFTLSYDRSGLGKSAYHDEKKDLHSMANELNRLIKTTELTKPFIIVGHSLGCQVAKEYASLYPADIKGLIFIDPGYNEDNLRKILPDSVWQKRKETLEKYLPPMNAAQAAEFSQLNENCKKADSISLTRRPTILFTATKINPSFPASTAELQVKKETHDRWLKQMPWAQQVFVEDSRHYIHNDKPQLVIKAILKMIE